MNEQGTAKERLLAAIADEDHVGASNAFVDWLAEKERQGNLLLQQTAEGCLSVLAERADVSHTRRVVDFGMICERSAAEALDRHGRLCGEIIATLSIESNQPFIHSRLEPLVEAWRARHAEALATEITQ